MNVIKVARILVFMVIIGIIGGFMASLQPSPTNIPVIIGTVGMEILGLINLSEEVSWKN